MITATEKQRREILKAVSVDQWKRIAENAAHINLMIAYGALPDEHYIIYHPWFPNMFLSDDNFCKADQIYQIIARELSETLPFDYSVILEAIQPSLLNSEKGYSHD